MHVAVPDPLRTDLGLLLLRLVAGGFLLPHGLGKLFGWFGGPGLAGFAAELRDFGLPAPAPLPLLLAAMQTVAGLCVVLGLFTPVAAALGAAFLATTAALNRNHGWFWMRGGMEYPLLWTVTLLTVGLLGGGQWSLDALLLDRAGAAP
jgi:putative oxidoreductase